MNDLNTIGLVAFCAIAIFIFILLLIGMIVQIMKQKSPPPVPGVTEPQATIVDATHSYAYLYPTGREVFFPSPPHREAVYEISIEGVLHREGSFSDAFYKTDNAGNFAYGADWLRVNGLHLSSYTHELVALDRCEHRYTIRIDHPSDRLRLSLDRNIGWSGWLVVRVRVLPEGTPSLWQHREQAKRQHEAHDKSMRAADELAATIKKLTIRSEMFRNWQDPEFRAKFAEVHAEELIRNQAEIREEATTFLAQDHIVRYFRRHKPEVVERFLGRRDALLMAERIVLDRRLAAAASPSAPPAPPRKKLTAEEVRALKVHRQQVAIGDKVALKLDKIETRLNIRERLEKMPLDQDEREMLEQELIGEIEEGDETHENVRTI